MITYGKPVKQFFYSGLSKSKNLGLPLRRCWYLRRSLDAMHPMWRNVFLSCGGIPVSFCVNRMYAMTLWRGVF